MIRYTAWFFVCIYLVMGLWACRKESKPPVFEGFVRPSHFPQTAYHFQTNPVTEAGFKLGKKLFYDGLLSRDGSISCASCHISYSAFSHPDHRVSHGIDGLLGTRNAPALQNLAWSEFFFWDGGVHDLDLFSIAPVENPVEMDETFANVLTKIQSNSEYLNLYKNAYGITDVTSARTLQALSQFMCMLISANSNYDKFIKGDSSALNAEAKAGLAVFRQKCVQCHTEPLFTDGSFRNNGLFPSNDKGRGRITQDSFDNYKFKVPSLRNIVHTFPYMHDGRFTTLESVLNHYSSGIYPMYTLDTLLRDSIPLTATEKQQITTFLQNLSDEEFIRNPLLAQ